MHIKTNFTGRPPFAPSKAVIFVNTTHHQGAEYYQFCKTALTNLEWASEIIDPTPANIADNDTRIYFFADLGWSNNMISSLDICCSQDKLCRIGKFSQQWENRNNDCEISSQLQNLKISL